MQGDAGVISKLTYLVSSKVFVEMRYAVGR